MIINGLVDWVTQGFAAWILSALPAGDAAWGSSLNLVPAFSAMMTFDQWFPVHETIVGAAFMGSLIAAIGVFATIRQVLRFLPFIGIG